MRKTDCIVVDSLAQKMMAKSNVLDSIGRFCREGEAEIGRKRSRCLAAVSATRSKQLTKSVLLRQVKRSRSLAIDTETESEHSSLLLSVCLNVEQLLQAMS